MNLTFYDLLVLLWVHQPAHLAISPACLHHADTCKRLPSKGHPRYVDGWTDFKLSRCIFSSRLRKVNTNRWTCGEKKKIIKYCKIIWQQNILVKNKPVRELDILGLKTDRALKLSWLPGQWAHSRKQHAIIFSTSYKQRSKVQIRQYL